MKLKFLWFALGVLVAVIAANVSFLPWHWEKIAQLKHPNRGSEATLWRLYGGIDGAYKIKLNGAVIWQSGDILPAPFFSHREVLDWDSTGNLLVFELGRVIVFAFDLTSAKALPSQDLEKVRMPTNDLRRIEYSGREELPGYREEEPANNGPVGTADPLRGSASPQP